MPSGDDLDDDFVPDDLIASAEEGDSSEVEEEFHGLRVPLPGADVDKAISKKRKRREKEKEKKAKKRKLAAVQRDTEEPSGVSQRPADAALYLWNQQKKAFPKLSAIELEELRIPESCIADTSTYTGPHTLDCLGDFIGKGLPQLMVRLSQKPRANGAPTLIFIAGAALRVADVTRIFRNYKGVKGGEIAKLFARHFKLQEHITYLERTKVGVAVGTPGRLSQLLERGLALTALTHIILDITHRDAKKRSMMDIPETRDEVFRGVLGDEGIKTALRLGKLQLALF